MPHTISYPIVARRAAHSSSAISEGGEPLQQYLLIRRLIFDDEDIRVRHGLELGAVAIGRQRVKLGQGGLDRLKCDDQSADGLFYGQYRQRGAV